MLIFFQTIVHISPPEEKSLPALPVGATDFYLIIVHDALKIFHDNPGREQK